MDHVEFWNMLWLPSEYWPSCMLKLTALPGEGTRAHALMNPFVAVDLGHLTEGCFFSVIVFIDYLRDITHAFQLLEYRLNKIQPGPITSHNQISFSIFSLPT
jgi:hypothetical protein